MHDIKFMEGLEAADYLYQQVPDLRLRKHSLVILVLDYLLIEITVICVFHHDAQRVVILVYKHFLVADYICVTDACQDSDFVNCVCPLLLAQKVYSYFLQCIVLLVYLAVYMIDA